MRGGTLPAMWLFTDERLGGDALWQALERFPRGAGIVFRHYGWPEVERVALLKRVVAFARRRGLIVVGSAISGAPDGVHLSAQSRGRSRGRIVTASAHDRREVLAAFGRGADLVFLSPVFATRSHPGSRTLGPVRFGLAARGAPGPVLALGGMDVRRARRMVALGGAGFGGIDCWVPGVEAPTSVGV